MEARPYLRKIRIDRSDIKTEDVYPFSIPAIASLDEIDFHRDVTFIVGENGSGKSTLIEAIALAMGFGPEGGTKNVRIQTSNDLSSLHHHIKLEKSFKRPKDNYFLRAESFYNVATYMDTTQYLEGYGGKSLHARSHGEAFFSVLTDKLRGNGFYVFDEPEAALSPSRQMAALTAIHDLVRKESQFIIATHSPILMAYPNSKILMLSEEGISEVSYEETEHFIRHSALQIMLQRYYTCQKVAQVRF
ncbi:MAG: AAA family ATPase [Pseudanabaenales cyanobacterium]|nr:AAA family ATPase [Pseudanabaenales cyanobacterium]